MIDTVEVRRDIKLYVVLKGFCTVLQVFLVLAKSDMNRYLSAIFESVSETASARANLWTKNGSVPIANVIYKVLRDWIELNSATKMAFWLCGKDFLLRKKAVPLVLFVQHLLIDVVGDLFAMDIGQDLVGL